VPDRFVNRVFHADALDLLRKIPTACIDALITDPMFGVAKSKFATYDWGVDPAGGDPVRHWRYHEPIYDECRRVLKPGGVLAWAVGVRFYPHFHEWFGAHRLWALARFQRNNSKNSGHAWIVQGKERTPIEFPAADALIVYDTLPRGHPCPKPVAEMAFFIERLTKPGQIVLDCFCGSGSSLVAAEQLGRLWIGCDKSKTYCQIAMRELANVRSQR
jgi:DNA modification methylase